MAVHAQHMATAQAHANARLAQREWLLASERASPEAPGSAGTNPPSAAPTPAAKAPAAKASNVPFLSRAIFARRALRGAGTRSGAGTSAALGGVVDEPKKKVPAEDG